MIHRTPKFLMMGAMVSAVALAVMPRAHAQSVQNTAQTNTGTTDEERFKPGETVKDRAQPEYDALGVRWGSFLVLPSITVKSTLDNNLFFDKTNARTDLVTAFSPLIEANSQWSQHELRVRLGSDILRHWNYRGEDHENIVFNVSGRLNVTQGSRLDLGADLEFLHEDRGSPDDADGVVPTPYANYKASALWYYKPARYLLEASADLREIDHSDVDREGSTPVNNDDRDRMVINGHLRAGYEFLPEVVAFAKLGANQRDYTDLTDDNGFNRDSRGYLVELGTDLDLGGKLLGDVSAGYMWQRYEDASLTDAKGYSANANIYWHVTQLGTLYTQLSRSTVETTVADASSYVSSNVTIGYDHELLRNLKLGLSTTYTASDYRGVSRNDDDYKVSLTADYKPARWIELSGGLGYDARKSSDDTLEYDHATMFVSIKLAL